MRAKRVTSADNGAIIEVRIPIAFRMQGSAKRIVVPDGAEPFPRLNQPNSTLVKAIARAFRWRKMLEEGTHNTIRDLATAEKINESYLSRVLRLTLLAPKIVEAILDGRKSPKLSTLMEPFSTSWDDQAAEFVERESLLEI